MMSMKKNSLHSSNYEDEIDLINVIQKLIESRKIIISAILFFTFLAVIYSLTLKPSFKSSAILEIGFIESSDGNRKLIESSSDLISDIQINLVYPSQFEDLPPKVEMTPLENNLIKFELTSDSSEINEKTLFNLISYSKDRHTKLSDLFIERQRSEISQKVEYTKSRISFLESKISADVSIRAQRIEDQILKTENSITFIDSQISNLEELLTADSNNLALLKGTDLQVQRALTTPTLEQMIFTYKSDINRLKLKKMEQSQLLNSLNKNLELLSNKGVNNSDTDYLFELSHELKNREDNLSALLNQSLAQTQPIRNVETITIKPQHKKILLMGLIFGFFAGIFIVAIKNFFESYTKK